MHFLSLIPIHYNAKILFYFIFAKKTLPKKVIFKTFSMDELNYGDDFQESPPEFVTLKPPLRKDDFGDDSGSVIKSNIGPVSEPQKLKLAKGILIFAFIILIGSAAAVIFYNGKEGVEKVWGFISTAINSIVSIIIGYYFASKHT